MMEAIEQFPLAGQIIPSYAVAIYIAGLLLKHFGVREYLKDKFNWNIETKHLVGLAGIILGTLWVFLYEWGATTITERITDIIITLTSAMVGYQQFLKSISDKLGGKLTDIFKTPGQ